jgi:hypothetical protein
MMQIEGGRRAELRGRKGGAAPRKWMMSEFSSSPAFDLHHPTFYCLHWALGDWKDGNNFQDILDAGNRYVGLGCNLLYLGGKAEQLRGSG